MIYIYIYIMKRNEIQFGLSIYYIELFKFQKFIKRDSFVDLYL